MHIALCTCTSSSSIELEGFRRAWATGLAQWLFVDSVACQETGFLGRIQNKRTEDQNVVLNKNAFQ